MSINSYIRHSGERVPMSHEEAYPVPKHVPAYVKDTVADYTATQLQGRIRTQTSISLTWEQLQPNFS